MPTTPSISAAESGHVGFELIHAEIIFVLLFYWNPNHFFSDLVNSLTFLCQLGTKIVGHCRTRRSPLYRWLLLRPANFVVGHVHLLLKCHRVWDIKCLYGHCSLLTANAVSEKCTA